MYPYKNFDIQNKKIERSPIFSINNEYGITIKELSDYYEELEKNLELLKKIIPNGNKEYSMDNIPIKIKRILNVFDLIKGGDEERKCIELDNEEYYWRVSNEKVNLILGNKNIIDVILDGEIKVKIEINLKENIISINIF